MTAAACAARRRDATSGKISVDRIPAPTSAAAVDVRILPADPLEVELVAREEEQHAQAADREELHELVGVDEAEDAAR